MQCCAWEGWEFELLGDTEDQLRLLRDSLAEWLRPRPLIRLSDVYDLSHYSPRIQEIGHEKSYYSPYIAKLRDDEGWFPDNISPMICWTPEGETEPVGISLDRNEIDKIAIEIAAARNEGREELFLKGFPKSMPLAEAENLMVSLRGAMDDVQNMTFPKGLKEAKTSARPVHTRSLVVKPNIERLDYTEEGRRASLARDPDQKPVMLRLSGRMLCYWNIKNKE